MPMNTKSKLLKLVVACTIVIAGAGCFSQSSKLCCIEVGESITAPDRSYCLDHEIAAQMFIQEPTNVDTRRLRLDAFERFFEMMSSCSTVDCIQAAIDTSTVVPGLKSFYDAEHADSEADLQIEQGDKAELIKCGFQHAIDVGVDN